MTAINCYLSFNGTCEAAFNFYKSVFGGEFSYRGYFRDMPSPERPIPESDKDKIMHISLPISQETILMGCDVSEELKGQKVVSGNNFTLCITPDSEAEGRRLFDALSTDGTITMPLEKTFWGSIFGMLTDQFGTNWMIDYELK